MAKQTVFTQNDRAIVNALKGNPDGLTLAELNEVTGLEIKSGHLVGAIKKGLVESIGEREISRPGKRKVATYIFVTAEAMSKEELLQELVKARIAEARLKKGYEVKGDGSIIHYSSKNTR